MSPLSNNNNNNNNTNSSNSLTSISSANNINNNNNNNTTTSHTSSSAFKPLVSENRQLNMLSSSVATAAANSVDPYGSDLSAYGSAYHHHHHHRQTFFFLASDDDDNDDDNRHRHGLVQGDTHRDDALHRHCVFDCRARRRHLRALAGSPGRRLSHGALFCLVDLLESVGRNMTDDARCS